MARKLAARSEGLDPHPFLPLSSRCACLHIPVPPATCSPLEPAPNPSTTCPPATWPPLLPCLFLPLLLPACPYPLLPLLSAPRTACTSPSTYLLGSTGSSTRTVSSRPGPSPAQSKQAEEVEPVPNTARLGLEPEL